ncbi:MAG TPA: glycoside hydrolase family 19 protein [Rhizobiaceae bacterium]|nr:glycoside hydrolase family 19 protein [Rhizobiaceae bacterium]
MITANQLRAMARGKPNAANLNSVLVALNAHGRSVGLDHPHRLAHYLAQLLHESGSFRYDRELWGPTPAQKRYEGRKDLGNVRKGDGSKYRGRTAGQVTGRANYRAFTAWARKNIDPEAPDFEQDPELINTDPWEGLGFLWYWAVGNPDGKSLNRYADDNNIEMITRRVNGGLNGFEDRLDYYGRAALVLLGYGTTEAEIKRFQREHPEAGATDGIVGQNTRMALHKALAGQNPFTEVRPIPVPVPKPVVPVAVEQKAKTETSLWQKVTGVFGVGGLGTAFLAADWKTVAAVAIAVVLMLVIISLIGQRLAKSYKAMREELA